MLKRVPAWAIVAASVFAIAWGGNEFTPLLTMYRLDHDLSDFVVDVLLFAYVLGIIPGLLLGGPLSDRFGRRALMLPAPLFAVAGSAVLAAGSSSAVVLFSGRVLSGVSIGLAMAVGGSWLTELSRAPYSVNSYASAGPRRMAMSLTAGFALGAAIAGVLAEWGPWPSVLPYVVHIVLAVAVFLPLLSVPETRTVIPARVRSAPLRDDLKIPSAGHRRFWLVILPVAPWVFGAAASAYAVLPNLMTAHSAGAPIAFGAFLCLIALGCGFGIQALGRRIDRPGSARGVLTAFALLVVALPVAALAAATLSVPLVIVAACLLGAGYGMALVSGLLEVQRIATPDDLAGLNAVFYSLSYLGFAVPAAMALGVRVISYPAMFLGGGVVAALCLLLVLFGSRVSPSQPLKANLARVST